MITSTSGGLINQTEQWFSKSPQKAKLENWSRNEVFHFNAVMEHKQMQCLFIYFRETRFVVTAWLCEEKLGCDEFLPVRVLQNSNFGGKSLVWLRESPQSMCGTGVWDLSWGETFSVVITYNPKDNEILLGHKVWFGTAETVCASNSLSFQSHYLIFSSEYRQISYGSWCLKWSVPVFYCYNAIS